jgi:hypothetical protein
MGDWSRFCAVECLHHTISRYYDGIYHVQDTRRYSLIEKLSFNIPEGQPSVQMLGVDKVFGRIITLCGERPPSMQRGVGSGTATSKAPQYEGLRYKAT